MLKNFLSWFILIFLFYSFSFAGVKRKIAVDNVHRNDRLLNHGFFRSRDARDADIPIQTYDGHQPSERELAVIMDVVKDDFIVNDDIIGGKADQLYPAIALDGNGNFVIVWVDDRNGNDDIYFQRYNAAGEAQGSNVKANNDPGTADQRSPAVAMDSNGNFVIVWQDFRFGPDWNNPDIYYQRYNSSGLAVGKNYRANYDQGTAWQWSPKIVMDQSGSFIIVWEDDRNGDCDIYFQRFNSNGMAQGGNIRVNKDTGTAGQYNPSIAIDGSGNFVIVWEDKRNGDYDIYLQRFNFSGMAQGGNVIDSDDLTKAEQELPAIAIDHLGNFVIAWQDFRNGSARNNSDIYYQRFDASGVAQGANTRSNDDAGFENQYYTAIAMDSSGNFVIAWTDYRNGKTDIYYQRYAASGMAQDGNVTANDPETISSWSPAIAMDDSGSFVIVWQDCRDHLYLYNPDIYYQRYNTSGVAQGGNVMANNDVGTTPQWLPAMAMDGSGNFVIVWEDDRHGNYDICYQRYNATGVAQGGNILVNNDPGTASQWHPAIAMNASGDFVIAWEDERNGWNTADINLQRYNSSGMTQGGNVKVNDDQGTASQEYPSIAINEMGSFTIAWQDYRNGSYLSNSDIYYQRYDAYGMTQRENIRVIDDPGSQNYATIAMDSSGNFVIAWQEWRNGYDIYFQRYNASGVAQGGCVRANNDQGMASQCYPEIAMNENGIFVIVWEDDRNGNYDIYYQLYNAFGVAQSGNVRVNDDTEQSDKKHPSIAIDDNGNFVIVWEDYRNGSNNPDIIGQRYRANGSRWGANYRIVADGPNYGETYPAVTANSSVIIFSWMDNRRSKGWDIYAKIATWDWDGEIAVEKGGDGESKPGGFELQQNYPNPFNPETSIRFDLSKDGYTMLRIYDVTGKLVKTLMNEHKTAGHYSIKWTGRNEQNQIVPSGIYFYQIRCGEYCSTKKMIMVK